MTDDDERRTTKGMQKECNFHFMSPHDVHTVESRFFEYSIIRNSRFFEPKVVSLGFASVKHCNFTPDFSNARFFETPDTSNYFFFPLKIFISRTWKEIAIRSLYFNAVLALWLLNYLRNVRGYPHFSFWIPITLAKIYFFPIIITFAKIHHY